MNRTEGHKVVPKDSQFHLKENRKKQRDKETLCLISNSYKRGKSKAQITGKSIRKIDS